MNHDNQHEKYENFILKILLSLSFLIFLKYPNQISHNLRQSIHKIKKKNYKACTHKFFSVPGKRTNRSLARTKHARFGKKKKSNQCWYFVVFGSRSVLLGVLLIKTLLSKCISQIRLDK